MKKKLLSCFAMGVLAMSLTSASVVSAATAKDDAIGLSVTIEVDKDSYRNGDTVAFEWYLENESTYTYHELSYAIELPEGVVFENSKRLSGKIPSIAGNARTTSVTMKSETLAGFEEAATPTAGGDTGTENAPVTDAPEQEGSGSEAEDLKQEESCGGDTEESKVNFKLILPVIFVVVLLAAGVVGFITGKKKKKRNSGGTLLLALLLGVSATAPSIAKAGIGQAFATSYEHFALTATETIAIEGVEMEISITVQFAGTADDRVSVSDIGIHDPSVFQDPVSGEFYSYGSHIIAGNSDDLVSWTYISMASSGYATANELFSKHYLEEFAEVYAWLGADVKEGIWALDVTYSEKAAVAGNDPYLMYVTVVNGSFKSAICLATSDSPAGPFSYKGMIVCSDYRESEVAAGKTNLLEVLGVSSVSEMTAAQRSFYFKADSAAYKAALPDCIDPAPFYDAEGNLYLTYGSFTCKGGLRVLKLDETTGLRSDETYEYKADGSQDPYFGRKIANANGEGPYILRVESELSSTGNYYFLFWSQGNLRSTGGYHMRMFRSEYPDFGYVDYAGQSALADISATNLGVRIMDGFQFTSMQYPSTANGGNSAIVTDEGKIFVHYHSKSSNAAAYGSEGFVIKSNQMFLNEDGWLVTAPYKYAGETMESVSTKIAGDYEFIYHRLAYYKDPVKVEDNYVSAEVITLNEDGTVTGAHSGTWVAGGNNLTITIDGKTYKGVILEQYEESDYALKTVVFTASGTDNRTVWGSRIHYEDAERARLDAARIAVPKKTMESFAVAENGLMYSEIAWSSDNEAIVFEDGMAKVICQDAEQTVHLTATVTYGTEAVVQEFVVTVPAEEFKIPGTISTSEFVLPQMTAAGKSITWTSSDASVIDVVNGTVNVPESGSKQVTLTGTIADSDRVITKDVMVMPLPTTVAYEESYDSVVLDTGNESSLWYSTNAAAALTLQNDSTGGKYVQFAPGNANSRGAISTFPQEGQVDGVYVLEFDVALTAGDNQTTEFAVATEHMRYVGVINDGISSGYLFKLTANQSGTTWTVNGDKSFEAAAGQWLHINALADTESANVALTITDREGNELFADTVQMNEAGVLRGFYIRGGRYHSVTAVDNVVIKQN